MPDPPAAIDAREVAPTIVLVHRLLKTVDVWRDMLPALTEHHRVVAVSLPGATPDAGNAIGMTVDDLAEAVYHHLLAQDVKHCVLVRHSVGGAVVLGLIAAHPDFAIGLALLHSGAGPASDLEALHRELEAGLRVSATYTVASCIRDWLDDGLTTRQASTVENYRRLADHAIGKLGAVKLKDLTARQVQKALAELSASLSTRSLRPPLLSTRLTRSLAHGEQLHWQPVVDRRGRALKSRVCLARPQPCLPT